jgi:putative ABC transport system permease protein
VTTYARLALVGLARAPGRTLTRIIVLAAAVALLGAMLLFIGHSLRTMTASATRSVPLDWQGPVSSAGAASRVARLVATQPGILQASPTATAPFTAAEHSAPAGQITAGSGAILAVPQEYLRHIRTFRFLQGSLKPGEIVLDQQLAATLQAHIGDTVKVTARKGTGPEGFKVSGVAVVTAPDVLFQPLNPLLGPAPAQPPANVVIMPLDTFAKRVAPHLGTIAAAAPGSSAVPGAQTGIQWQVQAQVDPATLTGNPSHAYALAGRAKNRIERTLPGKVQFVDNLAESLNTAAGDALYAQTLFIMLALPGALIALGLAYLAALGTVERDRRELALLRARGASRRALLAVASIESALIGIVAGLLGAGSAFLAVRLLIHGGVGLTGARVLSAIGVCVALAFVGASAARIGVSLAVFRGTVNEGRRSARRHEKPLWERLYLDVISLAVSGLVYYLTARTGFSAVVNPDSNPTLSLSVYMFLAPALLWLGATLLLVRLRGRALAWLVRRGAGERATTPTGFLLGSAGRRGPAINRGLVVVGLLLAFGVNLGIFTATYNQQARVDAQLTLGADVVVTAPPGIAARNSLEQKVARIPGVSGTTGVDHSYAYVGADLQDTYGIDAATFTKGTSLRDSYFVGSSASKAVGRLRATPDGILVSRETITDYSLRTGDLLKLRVLDRSSGKFHVVPFHVVGVVQEFPSAPKDSFMVTNLSYLQRVTHDPGPNVIFVKAKGDPVAVSRRIASATRSDGALVKNIRQQTVQTVSSITTVDLTGISRIEEFFALILSAAAMALFVSVGLAERRHEFATMAAIGASLREVSAFLWSEAALVLTAGLALAAVLGWLLSKMLIAMLQHVFDPPPDHLAVPWTFLTGLAGAAILGTALAALLAGRAVRRLPLGAILREE